MSGSGSGPLVPTFTGFVSNSVDGLLLFEACLSGKLHHVPRRPHDRERSNLIKSGSIFIYEENASGIKRWTDGVAWSPSRILGNFLIYRELEKPFPPGEKKRAMKRKRSSQIEGEASGRRESVEDHDLSEVSMPPTPPSPKPLQTPTGDGTTEDREMDRQLIGSLVDSYGFRPDGLVKKTMSIAINGVSHHLVSYYKIEDVKRGALRRPFEDPRMQQLQIRSELYLKQNFRTPIEEGSDHPGLLTMGDPAAMHAQHGYPGYAPMIAPQYGMRSGQHIPNSMYAPGYQGQYQPAPTSGASYQSSYQQAPSPGQGYQGSYQQPPSAGANYQQSSSSAGNYQQPASSGTGPSYQQSPASGGSYQPTLPLPPPPQGSGYAPYPDYYQNQRPPHYYGPNSYNPGSNPPGSNPSSNRPW